MKELLNLPPGGDTFPVEYGAIRTEAHSIRFTTRSMLAVLAFRSNSVDLPAGDELVSRLGRAETDAEQALREKLFKGLLRAHTSPARPSESAIAVRYRGKWFYIDDRDAHTKKTFSFLALLLTLQAGEVRTVSPVLTVPAVR